MPRGVLVLLLALIALVCALVVFLPSTPPDPGTTEAPPTATAEAPPVGASLPRAADDSVARSAAAPPREAAVERATDGDFLPGSTSPDALRVRCVDRGSGAPLPGALVYRLDQSSADEYAAMRAMMTGTSIPTMREQLGEHYRADAAGEVLVPYGDDLAIGARHGELFQLALVSSPTPGETVVLDLFRQARFDVEVVDAEGRPLPSAHVAIRMMWEEWRFEVLVREAEADGVARFAEFDALMQSGLSETLRVGLAEVLPEPVELPLPEAYKSVGEHPPLRLVMPPTGAVEVAVLDHAGQPCADGVIVRLVIADPATEDEALGGGDGRTATALTVGGVARFGYVGLGLALRAAAFLNGPTQPSEARGEGPRAAGEQIRLELHEDTALAGVSGTLTLDGKAYADQDALLTVRHRLEAFHYDEDVHLRTDATGGFRVQLRPPDDGELPESALWLTARQGERTLLAELRLPADFGRGVVELGELALEDAPVLAAGRVVDTAGQPLHGARISVQYEEQWGDDPAQRYWSNANGLESSSGPDGSFRIVGLPPQSDALRLVARHGSALPALLPFEQGATGLAIVLQGAGVVEGSVQIDEGFPADRLAVRVDYPSGLPAELEALVETVDAIDPLSRRFRLIALPPGVVRLTVLVADTELEIAHLEGLVVGPGAPPDPRLEGIDLRGKVFLRTLTLLGPPGAKVDIAAIRDHSAGDVLQWAEDGVAALVTTAAAADLEIYAEGFRTLHLPGVGEDRTVTLQRGIPVAVRWQGGLPETAGRSWAVRLSPIEAGPADWMLVVEESFDASGEALLDVAAPGTWRLELVLVDESWNRATVGLDNAEGGTLIQLLDRIAVQEILVSLDEDGMRRAEAVLAASH